MARLERLRKNKEFVYAYRKGKRINSGLMTLVYVTGGYCVKQGYSVSKKVGNSVVRNKVRRRMKEAFRLMGGGVKSSTVVFVARPGIALAGYHDIDECMTNLLGRASLLKPDGARRLS